MITQFNRDRPVKNLPDAYCKTATSNNAKILGIEKKALDTLRETIAAVYDSLDIDKAHGKTLDLYGDMFGQTRGSATDDQFRVLIKNRIIRNLSNADYNSIVNALCVTFNCEPSEILFVELDDPCKVKMEGLPISKLNENNIDINTAAQIIQGLMPAGVKMTVLDFTGTFEFSGGTELVYDESAGFADDAQTFGGYLGLMAGSDDGSESEWLEKDQMSVLGNAILGQMMLGES